MMWKAIKNMTQDTARIFTDEIRLIVTDAGAVLFFIAAMFIYSLLYALGYEKETVKDLPIAVVDMDHTVTSCKLSRMADATEQLRVAYKPTSLDDAKNLFFRGDVYGVLLIPKDFEKDILAGIRTSATVYCDASYFMLYKQVYSGAVFSTETFGAGIQIQRLLAKGNTPKEALDKEDPLKAEVYELYNPSGGYGSFVMPGMIIIIMQQLLLVGIGMLGGTIREKKMFLSMNRSVSQRWRSFRVVFAKASAYVLVFLFTALFSLGILHRWYIFPDHGHFLPILTFLIIYLYAVSFLGLAVSMLFKERVQSILFLVFISPIIVFISGLSWPVSSLPLVIRWVSHIFPCTFMVPAYIRLRIYGAGFDSVTGEAGSLLLQMVLYFIMAGLAYRYSLRRFGKKIGRLNKKNP